MRVHVPDGKVGSCNDLVITQERTGRCSTMSGHLLPAPEGVWEGNTGARC